MAELIPPRHSASEVLSLRHTPTWLLLAAAAGAVNAGAFTWAERYVSHLTGAVTQLRGDWGVVIESAFLPFAFILGAGTSVLALQARSVKGLRPAYASPLVVVTVLITTVAIVGRLRFAATEAGASPRAPRTRFAPRT
jgi:hypothetical protein